MSGVEHGSDVLANLPLWAQVAASFGMFFVAVVAPAIGFSRRVGPWMWGSSTASASTTSAVNDALTLHHVDEMLININSTLARIAGALEGMHAVMQDEARDRAIDREVKRRLEERGVKGATK